MTPADLIAWRKGLGLKQGDAAKMLGMSFRKYWSLENGITSSGFRVPTIGRAHELMVRGLDAELAAGKAEVEGIDDSASTRHRKNRT